MLKTMPDSRKSEMFSKPIYIKPSLVITVKLQNLTSVIFLTLNTIS